MLTDEEITAFYNKMTEFCATQTFASFRWETANVGEKQTQIIGVISFNDRAGGDMEAMSFSVISDSSQLILTTPGGIDKTVDFNNDDSAFTAWQDFFDEQRALYTQAITQLKTYPASKIIPEAANDDTPTLLDFFRSLQQQAAGASRPAAEKPTAPQDTDPNKIFAATEEPNGNIVITFENLLSTEGNADGTGTPNGHAFELARRFTHPRAGNNINFTIAKSWKADSPSTLMMQVDKRDSMNRVTDRATIVPEHLMVYYGTDGSLNERRSIDFAQSPAAAVNAWVASQPVTSLATPLSQEAPYLDVLPKTHSITLSGDDAVAFRLLQKLADQHTANAGNVETVISTQSGTVGLTAMEDPLALNVLNAPIKGPFAFELTVDPEKAKNLDLPPLSIAISPEKNAVTLTGVDADGEQHTRNLTLDNPDDVVAAFDELLKNYAKLEAENEAE